ncbi:TonB-dependent receptor domain-containing protein [Indioceanicola profundi]|uniref:TonB-dependent receptor domain-containing protein n=1 Tax=Indioceanicola profundi TaxID=2220096 RepID=UPI000E6AB330|nr:TonB-dependent receptor [Indioceanicola profundi]
MSTVRKGAMRGVARLALMAVIGCGMLLPPAQAQTVAAEQRFEIPAGPLGTALARLGQQAGIIIAVDPVLVRDRGTPGLSGTYAPAVALELLLADSGLQAQPDGQGGFRVVAAPPPAAAAPAPVRPVAAVAADAAPPLGIEEIVVVGTLTDVAIGPAEIERRQALDLSDLFRRVPSVSVGGSVGIAQKIYVRGLEDSLLNVTVDGAPQRGTLFHHIGRVSIEPELLESVEVRAGAGEATSGFGAIGGAIRFKTKDADDLLEAGRRVGALAKAGWFSNDGHKLSGTLFGRLIGDFGVVGSFVHVDRDDMEDGARDTLRGTAAEQQLAFVKLGGRIAEDHRLSLSYEHRDEEAAFGQRPNWPVLEGERLFPAEAQRRTAVLNYAADLGLAEVEATGYWTESEFTQDRFDRWGLYGAEIRSQGFDLRGRTRLAEHAVVAGVEYRDDRVASGYRGDPAVWGDWAWDPEVGRFVETGEVLGLYAQDHWQVMEPLLLSFGIRYDAYDLSQVTYGGQTDSDGLSLNAGFTYDLPAGFALNAGYAEAFRGKEVGDAFTLEKRPGRISIAPGLEPEQVDNYEIGLTYGRNGFSASAVYYNTRISDVILDQLGNGAPPQDAVYYENVGTYRTDGVELRAGYVAGPFSVDAYFNHYVSKLNGNRVEGYEHIALGNSVGDNWNVTVGYSPLVDLELEASVTRFHDLNDIEVLQRSAEIGWIDGTRRVDKPGYTVLDLFARWQPLGNDRLTLLAAVYNLLDKRYRAHSSVADYNAIPGWEGIAGVYEPGRDIRLTAAVRF